MSPLIGPWWITWLISGWVGRIAFSAFFKSDASIDDLIIGNLASFISDGVSLVSLILIIVILRQITSNQERKYGELAANSPRSYQ